MASLTRPLYVLLLAILPLGPAIAAVSLPNSLTGTWSSKNLQYADSTRLMELYLGADGIGVLIGYVNPNAGEQVARQFGAMPIQATLEGEVLTTRPLPADEKFTADIARMAADMTLICQYDGSASTLVCADPKGVKLALQRRSERFTPELAEALTILRSQLPSKYWPPSAPGSAAK